MPLRSVWLLTESHQEFTAPAAATDLVSMDLEVVCMMSEHMLVCVCVWLCYWYRYSYEDEVLGTLSVRGWD